MLPHSLLPSLEKNLILFPCPIGASSRRSARGFFGTEIDESSRVFNGDARGKHPDGTSLHMGLKSRLNFIQNIPPLPVECPPSQRAFGSSTSQIRRDLGNVDYHWFCCTMLVHAMPRWYRSVNLGACSRIFAGCL